MIRQLILLGVIGWLPGAVLFRIPWFDRPKRAALDAEERWFWQIVLSIASALAAVLGLAAAARYRFDYLIAVQLACAVVPVALWRRRLQLGSGAPRPGITIVIPITLVLLGGIRFFPPAEYIIAGKDPGTYVNEGVLLAQRGSLVIEDSVVASVPQVFRDLFYPSYQRADYYGLRFMGFFIQDPDNGRVVGQFPHLFPAALAIGYGIDGLTGIRRTTPVLAILGLLAVYFAAVPLFGRPAAAAAAILLSLNIVQVWFARYPNAEVLLQIGVFAAVLGATRWQLADDSFFVWIAGGLLGLLLFLRFDLVLAIGAVGAGLLLVVLTGRRVPWSFLTVLLPLAILSILYLRGPMRAYSAYPVAFVHNLPAWQHVVFAAVLAVAAMMIPTASRSPRVRTVVVHWAPLAVASIVGAAALYALFLRHPQGRLAYADAYALRTFANFYVTVPVTLAAILGYVVYARAAFWRSPAFFLVTAFFGFFYFYKLRIVPEHFWAARRFVGVILPATLMLASAIAIGGRGFGNWPLRIVRVAIGAVFLVIVAVSFNRASAAIDGHVEYAGLIPRVEALAARLGDRDLLLVEARDAGSDVHVFGLPLAYIYGRNVLVLSSARPDKGTLAAFVSWAQSRYARTLFLGGGGSDLLSFSYGMQPLWSDRFQVPEYQSLADGYPRFARQKEFEYGVYTFTAPAPRGEGWFDLDVGVNDNLNVVRFHAREATEGRTFRWTGALSYISVTNMTPGAREVTLVLADGGRPPAAPPAIVDVFLHNQQLGSLTVSGRFKPYFLPIPPDVATRAAAASEPVELRFVTRTWNPSKVLGSGDDRQLGVMVDRVTIK